MHNFHIIIIVLLLGSIRTIFMHAGYNYLFYSLLNLPLSLG